MIRPAIVLLATLATALCGTSAGAEETSSPSTLVFGAVKVELPAEYRFAGTHVTAMDAEFSDRDDTAIPAEMSLQQRLRFSPTVSWAQETGFVRLLKLSGEVDLLDGAHPLDSEGREVLEFAADPGNESDMFDPDNIMLRKAYGVVATELGYLKVGRQLSNWGLGLVANDGGRRDMSFGLRKWGDVVDRAQLVLRPVGAITRHEKKNPLYLVVAADRVVRDDSANLADGVTAYNLIGSMLLKFPSVQGGVYVVRRTQEESARRLGWECVDADCVVDESLPKEDLQTDVWVFDAFAAGEVTVGPVRLYAEGEAAMLAGETELFSSKDYESHKLEELGFVARGGADFGWTHVRLEFGYASGDTDSHDDRIRSFKFDRDYSVGLVLFGEYLGNLTAASAWNLSRPHVSHLAPAGYSHIPTDGAVTNAMYVNPVVKLTPSDNMEVLLGVLYARAEEEAFDPFQSGMMDGAEVKGYRGAAHAVELGWELDLAISYAFDLWGVSRLESVIEAGWLRPGEAFESETGDPAGAVGVVQARLHLTW